MSARSSVYENKFLVIIHDGILCTLVSFISVCGMYWGHRRLMLPWLFLQGFLASILAALVRFI